MKLDDVKVVLQVASESLKGVGFFPGVEAIAGVPLKLIEFYETVTANKKERNDLISALVSLQEVVISPIEAAHKRGDLYAPGMTRRIDQLREDLNAMKTKLDSFDGLGRWRSFRKKDEISAVLRDVNRDLSISISQFQLGGQISVEVQLWETVAQRLVESLNPSHARFDASDKQPCLPGTRSVLLATIREHINSASASFVCLYGSPGTGKSAVARSISDELDGAHRLAASYFFDKRGGAAGNASLSAFVSTLVYQLAHYDPYFRTALSLQLKQDPLLAGAAAEVRLRKLLLQPLQAISQQSEPPPRWIIVLDALDECGDSDHQQQLMHLLRSCASIGDQLIFFLTARPEAEITHSLGYSLVDSRVVVESMDKQDRTDTDTDIEVFVRSRLSEMSSTSISPFVPPPADVKEFAVLCGGLFEIAAVRLRQMNPTATRVPLRKGFPDALQIARRSSSSRSPLQKVYLEILNAAYEFSDDPDRREEMLRLHCSVVGALTVLRQPLAISTLAALVDLEEDEARMFLEPLSSLIAVPNDNQPVHFYHTSFLDFLTSSPQSLTRIHPNVYAVDSVQCDVLLAKRGLVIMNDLLRQNILDLADPSQLNDDIQNLAETLAEHVPEHLRYACLHWADHLRDEDTPECCDLLVSWCYDKIMSYLEVLSLLGNIGSAVLQFLKARDWISKIREMEEFADVISDSYRLTQTFHPAISHSAAAVYSCAIPLMPSCALVPIYSHLAPGDVEIVCGRPPSWSPLLWVLPGPTQRASVPYRPCSISYSPDGNRIVTGLGNSIRIVSSRTGEPYQTFEEFAPDVVSVRFSSNGKDVIAGLQNGTIRIWSDIAESHHPESDSSGLAPRVHQSLPEDLYITPLAFSPDDTLVVAHRLLPNSDLGNPRDHFRHILGLWNRLTGMLVHELWLRQHELGDPGRFPILYPHPPQCTFSPDGTHVIYAAYGGLVGIWSVSTGERIWVLDKVGQVTSLSLSPDGKLVAAGYFDGSVHIWSTKDGRAVTVVNAHDREVRCVTFCSEGKRIASASDDCSVRVWFIETRQLESAPQAPGIVVGVAFSSDGEQIASVTENGTVCVWSTATAAQRHAIQRRIDAVYHPDPSPDDMSEAIESTTTSRPLVGVPLVYDNGVRALAVSRDGQYVVSGSGSDDCIVRMWSATTGRLEREFIGHRGGVNSVALSSGGTRIASGSDDQTVRIWSASTGELRRILEGHVDRVASVAISPNDACVASAGMDGSVRLWSTETGEMTRVLYPHPFGDRMDPIFFTSDGERVLHRLHNGEVDAWSTRNGTVNESEEWGSIWATHPNQLRLMPSSGQLHVHEQQVWLPLHLRGNWLQTRGGVVIHSDDRKGLIIIRIQPKQ